MLSKLKENFALIVFGLLWGILELTLGGFLHYIHYPLKGQIMSAIGYALLAACAIRYRKVWGLLIMGFIAASLKLFTIFIFGVPLLSMMIVNPAVSIIIEASAAASITFVFVKLVEAGVFKRVVDKLKLL